MSRQDLGVDETRVEATNWRISLQFILLMKAKPLLQFTLFQRHTAQQQPRVVPRLKIPLHRLWTRF